MYDVKLQTELSHPDLLRPHSLSTLSVRMFPEPGAEWDTEVSFKTVNSGVPSYPQHCEQSKVSALTNVTAKWCFSDQGWRQLSR